MSAEFEFQEFLDFAQNFHKTLQEETFVVDVMDKLGNVYLRDMKANTPVGQYDDTVFFTGRRIDGSRFIGHFEVPGHNATRQGGQARRNWKLLGVQKVGDTYVVTISNNTEYISYVNDGHRKADHSGWVEGQHFVEITMDDMMNKLPRIVGPLWRDYLERFGL